MIALMLAATLLLALLPQTVLPQAEAASNSCGAKLTWSFKNGTLTITGSGDMYNYGFPGSELTVSAPWAKHAAEIRTVKLPSGLTSIGECAFAGCTALKSVAIPDKVTRIGYCAFDGCTALQEVVFPKELKTVGHWAFRNCAALKEALLFDKVTQLGYGAFSGCKALGRVLVLNANAAIGVAIAASGESSEDLNLAGDPTRSAQGGGLQAGEETSEDLVFMDLDAPYTLGLPAKTMLFGKSKTGKVFQLPPAAGVVEKGTYLQSYAKTYKYSFYPVDKFADVKDADACLIPVAWAVGNKVTAGMDATHFAPTQTVTRAQAMTFFWAAQKKPAPKTTASPFVDVKKTDWYFKSVMWAVENGVTAGTDATHFSPNKTCNRGEILAFLYASLKKPKVSVKNPYADVSSQWYKKAALWAWANGIERGENGRFNASTPCTRASTVTYLYRFFTGMGLMQ